MNTEPDKKSYKGIAPIFMQGREPYPYPNALIFAENLYLLSLLLLHHSVSLEILLNGYYTLNVRIVLCCV